MVVPSGYEEISHPSGGIINKGWQILLHFGTIGVFYGDYHKERSISFAESPLSGSFRELVSHRKSLEYAGLLELFQGAQELPK